MRAQRFRYTMLTHCVVRIASPAKDSVALSQQGTRQGAQLGGTPSHTGSIGKDGQRHDQRSAGGVPVADAKLVRSRGRGAAAAAGVERAAAAPVAGSTRGRCFGSMG